LESNSPSLHQTQGDSDLRRGETVIDVPAADVVIIEVTAAGRGLARRTIPESICQW
jgi:hypothetical protein